MEGLPLAGISEDEVSIIKQQIKKEINSPLTSSAGRLFDAVSAITGVCLESSYEAQAAIELEMHASSDGDAGSYPFYIDEQPGIYILRLAELFTAILTDTRNKLALPLVSLKLHHTAAAMIVDMCQRISRDTGLKKVVLSGGVFQNRLLLKLASHKLKEKGFTVYSHHLVPCNDGGISLGQAVAADNLMRQ